MPGASLKTAERRRRRVAPADAGRGGPDHARRGRVTGWIPIVLALLHALLGVLVLDPTPHTGGDNAAYIALARALIEHGAYIELWDPALPAHTQYPPVFAGIIGLALMLGLSPWVHLKLLIIAFSTVAVGFSYLWAREWASERFAIALTAVLALSPGVLHLGHWILSDVPFWAMTLVALWAFERMRRGLDGPERGPAAETVPADDEGGTRDGDRAQGVPAGGPAGLAHPGPGGMDSVVAGRRHADRSIDARLLVVATLATALALFTRSAGLPLVIAGTAWLAWRVDLRRAVAFGTPIGALAFVWWLRARRNGGISYADQFLAVEPYVPELGRIDAAGLFVRIGENAIDYLEIHLPRLLVDAESGAWTLVSLALAALALAGWARRLRSPGAAELFTPLYLGLLLVWPAVWSGERFLLPALPLVLAYAGSALVALARRAGPRAGTAVGAAATAALLLAGTPGVVDGVRFGNLCMAAYAAGDPYPCLGGTWSDFYEIAEWSGRELPPDAVVISRKPRLFYGLSGRAGAMYPKRADPDEFFELVRRTGARYLVLGRVDALWQLYVAPVLADRPDRFCVVHALGAERAAVLRILPETGGGTARVTEDVVELSGCPAHVEAADRG